MSRLTHLEQQVRDMLVFARGETRLAEQLPLAALGSSLKSAVEGLTLRNGSQIHWQLEDEDSRAAVLCNRDALVGACVNLVNNSLEAGATQVTIAMKTGEVTPGAGGQPNQMILTVTDNGPGFEPAQREQLLEAFYTTKSHGTGLGLAVVQAVVKAHHGEFVLESVASGGAQACLRLPLAPLDTGTYRTEQQ